MEKLRKLDSLIEYEYDILPYEKGSLLLFYVPYAPFQRANGCAYIDSFYLASNKAYSLAAEYAAQLNAAGTSCCPSPKNINYKEEALKCGGCAGKNTLFYRKGAGSRFAIGALLFKEVIEPTEKRESITMPCKTCTVCENLCPSNALKGGFDRNKCIRQYMLKPEKADENILKAFGTSIIGCDICQSACPMNKNSAVPLPREIGEMLKFENLLNSIENNRLEKFALYFGANYTNKNSLLAMLLIAMGNSGDKKYTGIIQKYIKSGSVRVKAAAAYALRQLQQTGG